MATKITGASAPTFKTKLSLLTFWPSTETLKAISDSFHKEHPTITVDTRLMEYPDYDATQAAGFAGGVLPDVIAQVLFYTRRYRGRMLPLNDLIAKYMPEGWEKWFYPQLLGDCLMADYPRNSVYYALPTNMQTSCLAYNPKLFKQLGLDVPNTWDELVTVCDKLKKAGKDPIIFGTNDEPIPWHARDWFMCISTQFCLEPEAEDGVGYLAAEKGKIKWTDPRFVKTCEALLLLKETVWQDANPNSISMYPYAAERWWKGDVGMIMFGTWDLRAHFASDMYHIASGDTNPSSPMMFGDENVGRGWFFPPITEMGAKNYAKNWYTATATLGIPNTTQYPDEAFQYIKYLTYGEGQRILWHDRWNFPSMPRLVEETTDWQNPWGDNQLENACMLFLERSKNPNLFFRREMIWPKTMDAITSNMAALFAGSATPSDCMNNIQETYEKETTS